MFSPRPPKTHYYHAIEAVTAGGETVELFQNGNFLKRGMSLVSIERSSVHVLPCRLFG
jgi:hypothetical protein